MNGLHQDNMEHVKRIFEQKTGVRPAARQRRRHPIRRVAVVMAGAACLLTVTAFAANYLSDGALMKFFQRGTIGMENGGGTLSGGQVKTISGYTAESGQRAAFQGTALTLESVTASVTSGNLVAYFVFEAETPEGALSGMDSAALAFESADLRYEKTSGMSSGGGGSIDMVLPGGQGRENVNTIIYSYRAAGVDLGNRETPMALSLKNLCYQEPIDRERLEQGASLSDFSHVVAEGEWLFELPFELIHEGVPLIDGPVGFPGYGYTLTSLELTPLCVAFSLGYPEGEEEDAVFAFCSGMRVVMRDGSEVRPMEEGAWEGGAGYGAGRMALGGAVVGKASMVGSFYFDAPLDLNEVDCILFAGGTRIQAHPAQGG